MKPMDVAAVVGRVLAASELIPGEPSDLTQLLRNAADRAVILGDQPVDSAPVGELCRYLARNLDPSRAQWWRHRVHEGISQSRYHPTIVGWEEYPVRLDQVWNAPPVLFRGLSPSGEHGPMPIDDPHERTIAIVGSRRASNQVLAETARLATALAESGVRVISGLAEGVDGAAHRAALAAGGATTAVIGTGLEHTFPQSHATLSQEIAAHGVLLSQFVPPAPRTGTTFLRRNAVIAALADVSIVMTGQARSGSRHEAEKAVGYGKQVLLWYPEVGTEYWAQDMVDAGAARFIESPDCALADVG